FFSSRRRHTISKRDWSSDVCSSDLLIEALQEGEIAAAGLDVFEQEPVQPDNPLLNMKNVVTTPHVGSSTHETELKMSELAAKNMEAGLNGVKPPNLIDQGVWQK